MTTKINSCFTARTETAPKPNCATVEISCAVMPQQEIVLHHDRMTPGDVRFFATDKNERFWVYCVNETEELRTVAQTFGQNFHTLTAVNKHNPCYAGAYILLHQPPQHGQPTSCGGVGCYMHTDKLGMETPKCASCGTMADLNTHFMLFDVLLCKWCWIISYGKHQSMENVCVICGIEAPPAGHIACDRQAEGECAAIFCEKHLKEYPLTKCDDKELCEFHADIDREGKGLESRPKREIPMLEIHENFRLVLRDTLENSTPFDVFGVTTTPEWRNEYQHFLDPAVSAKRVQSILNSQKLQRKKFELAFNQKAKHNRVTGKAEAIRKILHSITDGNADKFCGMCVHTQAGRATAGCLANPALCLFPNHCPGVKDTVNQWFVVSAIRRSTATTGDVSMDTILSTLLGPSRLALLGLAPTGLCTRAYMQRKAETIEEEFALSTGSLDIFNKEYALFRPGHEHELQKAPQRFARMIKKWNVHSADKGKSPQAVSAPRKAHPQRLKPRRRSLTDIPSTNPRGTKQKHDHTHQDTSTFSLAAAYNWNDLYKYLNSLKTFWEGRTTAIDKERDLSILKREQHNGPFFAMNNADTLSKHGYGERFIQSILFLMTKDGFTTLTSAEPH